MRGAWEFSLSAVFIFSTSSSLLNNLLMTADKMTGELEFVKFLDAAWLVGVYKLSRVGARLKIDINLSVFWVDN